jgi:arsenate reductase (thioredoxin)
MKHDNKRLVLFVCEHGSAKSVVAAAHFNRLARERDLDVQAVSRGTDPDETIPSFIINGLEDEGLTPGEMKPKVLSKDDVARAARVTAFCDLPDGFDTLAPIAQWDEVPPISEDYNKSRDAMLVRINQLLEEMPARI